MISKISITNLRILLIIRAANNEFLLTIPNAIYPRNVHETTTVGINWEKETWYAELGKRREQLRRLLGSRPKMTFCLQWTLLIDWFIISIALWFDIVTHVSFFIFSAKGTAGSYIWFVPLHCSFLPRSYVIPPSFSRRSYVLPYVHWFFFTLRWDTHMIQTVVHSPLHVRRVTHGTLLTDGARPKLKGISHLGRIRVRSFPDTTVRVPTQDATR